MPFLKVFTGGEERTVFLGDDPIVFGRGDDVDVLLKDVKVSREHCVIEKNDKGAWRVLDLQSGNGTRVNGAPIRSHVLEPEDVVEVGDAKVLFAAEAAAVVVQSEPEPVAESVHDEPRERPARASSRRAPAKKNNQVLFLSLAVAGVVALLFLWKSGGSNETDAPTNPDGKTTAKASAPVERTEPKPSGPTAASILAELPADLSIYDRVTELEARAAKAPRSQKPAYRAAVEQARAVVKAKRDVFFGALESEFRKQLEAGQFSRAREMWFFLRGDDEWTPIPRHYRDRIIQAMTDLEHQASAARTKVLDDVSRAQDAHDFDHAEKLVRDVLPRFAGTSVERSLHERLEEIARARAGGRTSGPSRMPTRVRADTAKQLAALLAQLPQRDFAAVAKGIQALGAEASDPAARAELQRRASEVQAAADLQAKLLATLAAGKAPKKQIAKRWRVLAGDGAGLQVRTKGNEVVWPWTEVPPKLHLALLAREGGGVGLAVAAHAIGGEEERLEALALVYADGRTDPATDRYLAEVVRKETIPEGGYVVHGGELLARAEFVKRQEEALIAQYKEQLAKAHTAILADNALKKLDKLIAKKNELDERRNHALQLIFDEKKYFYPYRDRMNEYAPVQMEVDARVEKVRELWEDRSTVKVKASDSMKRSLKAFDEAVRELKKRFVDVEEKVDDINFLRSYFGKKFDIRTLYRTGDERELLSYSVEVMEWNTTVSGDITSVEREQVRVTNEYRMMFGRWPVRIVALLVKSSRDHCEEMSRLGYFGHFSPTPGRKTPFDRMRLVGYQFGSSENCVMGTSDPKSAHERWCHSSGHHRNLLTAAWTEMGTGHYGRYMTQNFGRAPQFRGKGPTTPGPGNEGPAPGDTIEGEDDEEQGSDDRDPYDYESED
ncbi:MAG: FHA domain-containing protein [Planctomycetota bacterium]